jgi:hypothetical protein
MDEREVWDPQMALPQTKSPFHGLSLDDQKGVTGMSNTEMTVRYNMEVTGMSNMEKKVF